MHPNIIAYRMCVWWWMWSWVRHRVNCRFKYSIEIFYRYTDTAYIVRWPEYCLLVNGQTIIILGKWGFVVTQLLCLLFIEICGPNVSWRKQIDYIERTHICGKPYAITKGLAKQAFVLRAFCSISYVRRIG